MDVRKRNGKMQIKIGTCGSEGSFHVGSPMIDEKTEDLGDLPAVCMSLFSLVNSSDNALHRAMLSSPHSLGEGETHLAIIFASSVSLELLSTCSFNLAM